MQKTMRSLLSIICCLAILLTCIGGIAIASADESVQFVDPLDNLDLVTSKTENLQHFPNHADAGVSAVLRA
ncbi:MAG: hypothetical protein IJC85_07000, partial [Oscillospiraceae bacterium]|nr:hypothetical protein [Oscillospiraceae bacterium]